MNDNKLDLYKFQIPSLGIKYQAFNRLTHSQRLPYLRAIDLWKMTAKHDHFDAKRKSFSTGLRGFIERYQPDEWLAIDGPVWSENPEVWYIN